LPEAPLEEPAAFETKPEPARDLANQPLAVLEQIIADDPTNSDAYYALARAYADQGRNRDALEAFAETVKYDPTNIAAQNDLGVMLFAQGQRVEAESALRRATALDPFSSTAHLNLALLLRATGRGQEANAEFAQARTNARDNRERALAESAALGRGVEMQLWGV
jgi:Flp pilus assembly protein TadD